ncbi:hypothetical protein ACI792_18290 [Blastococcus sp. SYSU DS0669]
MRNVQRATVRTLATAGLAAGLALVLRPQGVVAAIDPRFPDERRWVARVLGARLVVQHGAVLVSPGPRTLRFAAAVDGLHAASMLPALALPRYRPAALVSGGVAALSALAAQRSAGSAPR